MENEQAFSLVAAVVEFIANLGLIGTWSFVAFLLYKELKMWQMMYLRDLRSVAQNILAEENDELLEKKS